MKMNVKNTFLSFRNFSSAVKVAEILSIHSNASSKSCCACTARILTCHSENLLLRFKSGMSYFIEAIINKNLEQIKLRALAKSLNLGLIPLILKQTRYQNLSDATCCVNYAQNFWYQLLGILGSRILRYHLIWNQSPDWDIEVIWHNNEIFDHK